MIVKCWGSRGSIPVSGREFNRYGGDTTCLEIRTHEDEIVIIDAGTGIRSLGKHLCEEGRNEMTLIFTHAHWDHLLGFPFFRPLYEPGTRVHIFGCHFAQASIEEILYRTMDPPFFPVRLGDVRAELCFHGACESPFDHHTLAIAPVFLNHPNRGVGYRIEEDESVFVFLTDNELTFEHPGGLDREEYLDFAKGADLLYHDAEYRPEEYERTRGWGHSVYLDALELALEAGVKRFGLFHHNQDRTDEDLDAMVRDCKRIISSRGLEMDCFAVESGSKMKL